MRTATEYFNLDTNLMTMEDYEKADLRLLVVFPSPATTKSVSMTASVLNDFVISKCPGVFIDFAFVPEQDDLSTFDKFMMPYAIGNITGLDASHYDLVGFSISILFEAMTTAMIVNSFSRCDRPIPLTWSERKDHKFGETPALYLGGITASVTDVLFGDVGDGRQAFVDFIHLGEFHCVKDFFDHCIESKKLGRTVQENLDTFWPLSPDHNWLYQPQAYKVTYNDRNQIVSNIKINPNAPDMCQPYYPDEIPHLNGAARGIIQGNGGNAGLGQFMAANGCSRSGFCNFSVAKGTLVASEAGLVRIEELEGCGPIRLQSTGVVTAQNVEKQRRERVYRVILESGSFLDCSLSHKWVRAVDVGKRERRYTTRQIRNRLKKGEEFVVLRKIGNHLGVGPLHYKVKSLISMSKRIDFRAMQKSFEDVEWTNKGYCYHTGLNYAQNMIEINNWITDFNFAGYDTSVEVTNRGYAVIYFWPVANSVVHDRVMTVIKLNKFSDMYDVVETDDHTVCYNSIVTSNCHEGAFTGGWVENTPDRLVELAKIARRYTAATTLKAYSFNCVSDDTPVITEEGIKRASQLSGNEKVVTPYGYSDFILNKGTSDSLEHLIMSQGADLKLTPNHRQLILSDSGVVEVPAKEVKVGDWIPFTVGTARTVARNSIWFALGLWYGDGCSTGNSNYFLFNLSEVDNAKNISPWIQRETKTTTPSVCCFLATKEFTRKVREIFPNGKEDISKLYSLGIQELVDFIQGLFDSDGSGVKGWLKITQKASRKELLNLISTGLLSVGVRTSFSPRIDVTLPGRQKVYSRYDLRVVGQESRIAFLQTFNNHTGKLDYVNCDDRISNRDLCIPPLVGVILAKEFVRVFGKIPSGFNRSKFFKGIKGITVSKFLEMFAQYKEVIPIVNDIVNGTRFAKVVSRETLKGNFPVVDVCETTGGVFNIAGFWTHNSNYLSDYKRSIYDWMSIFPHVTFNNMRLEELGLDPDALKMMKLSGYKRMTAPLEGVSQRVRNNFLNKNLSEKAIDAYLTYGMMMGAVECKIGIVLTGFEEDQDWQEFFDFNEKWQKKAREMGGKIPFRYNMTYLVHYPHTPAEYWERRSVRTALYGGFLMPYKWNKKMTDNKIRIKINGFKHSTLIEQALIDLGRELTSWLYQYLIKPGYPIYSFKPVVNRKEAWEELVSRINIDYFFNERKFDEYISVSHRIHVALHANVILQAMRTLQGGLNAQPTIRCLKTYDGCPVECKANAFARSPLVTYGDAWINDKGKLEGVVWEEVKGCQRCKTVEDRKKVLTRTLPKSKTANDILSFKAPALRLRLRFRVERSEPYDVLSPRTTAFTSLSLFLKESQELTDMFWELENNYNMYWQSEKEYFYTVSGQMIYDVTFRDRKAKEIVESLINKVNAKAKTFRIISVSEVPLTSQIKPTDLNVFYFESTIPAELWQYASMMYKGEVKAEDESGMMATKIDSSLRPPQFTLEDKVKGYFVIPCRYSPWCYLQGLMSSKRVALRKLLKTTKVRCLTTVRETNISCVCGKENAVVDMTTGFYKPLGLDCLVNWFTNKIKK